MFAPEALAFYDDLAANNTKAWWTEHRADYVRLIREPMLALVGDLEDEFGPAKVYRPNRDMRFAKGAPYKDHCGAFVPIEDGVGYYVQFSASGLMTAGGWYAPQGRQLARFRAAVDSPAVAALEPALRLPSFTIDGAPLKTRPRGVDPEHPRLDLLRMTRLIALREHGAPAWLDTSRVVGAVRRDWRRLQPMVEWLADHVGPVGDPDEGVGR